MLVVLWLAGMLILQLQKSDNVLGENAVKLMRSNYNWARKHIIAMTGNTNLLRITLHSFRHFYAAKLYLQTGNIRFIQKKLGHRSIQSTTIYENSTLSDEVEQYTIKVVSTKEEAQKLGELGFEPFDEIDGVKLYRKRLVNV